MNRRAFLRRTVCIGVAAVAMPYVSRSHFRVIVAWLRKAWPRERDPFSLEAAREKIHEELSAVELHKAAGYIFSTSIATQIIVSDRVFEDLTFHARRNARRARRAAFA